MTFAGTSTTSYLERKLLNSFKIGVTTQDLNHLTLSLRNERSYMQQVIDFVRMQWHAKKWHNTLLDCEHGLELGIKWIRRYCNIVPRRLWDPGFRMCNFKIFGPRSRYSLRFRGLPDILYRRVINSNSLELMLSISYVLGFIAFLEMIPPNLLEVDPTLVLYPEKVKILREVLIPQGFNPLNVLNDSVCTDNPVHNQIGEDLQEMSLRVTPRERLELRKKAFAIALAAVLMGVLLNGVTTSNTNITI